MKCTPGKPPREPFWRGLMTVFGGQPKLDVIFFLALKFFFFCAGVTTLVHFFPFFFKKPVRFTVVDTSFTRKCKRMRNARADIQHCGQHRTASCSTLQGLSGVEQPGPSIRGPASYPIQSPTCIDHAYPKWKMELNSVTTHDPT